VPLFVEAVRCIELVPRQARPRGSGTTLVLVYETAGGEVSLCSRRPPELHELHGGLHRPTKHTTSVCQLGYGTEHWLVCTDRCCMCEWVQQLGLAAGWRMLCVLELSLSGHRAENVLGLCLTAIVLLEWLFAVCCAVTVPCTAGSCCSAQLFGGHWGSMCCTVDCTAQPKHTINAGTVCSSS
jgi:hypothetical protein